MKIPVIVLFVFCVVIDGGAETKLTCKAPAVDIPKEWITMADPCTKKMQAQIQEELVASMTYFAMGTHFSRDVINRPGFAKFFFDSASEEREHAIKLINYMLMRGGGTGDIAQLIRDPMPLEENWPDAISALKKALKLEASVTRKLRDIASVCEDPGKEGNNFNDYHLVDWITNEYLDEQYKAQRYLAQLISKLGKMMENNGALGEDMMDKKLLLSDDFVTTIVGA